MVAAASESSNIDEDVGWGGGRVWLGWGSSSVVCNWEFVWELQINKLLLATLKLGSVSAAMKTESGIDVTKKEEYLSAEDFITVTFP